LGAREAALREKWNNLVIDWRLLEAPRDETLLVPPVTESNRAIEDSKLVLLEITEHLENLTEIDSKIELETRVDCSNFAHRTQSEKVDAGA